MTQDELSDTLPDSIRERIGSANVKSGVAMLVLDVSGLGKDARSAMQQTVTERLESLDGIEEVRIAMTAERKIPRILAVGSGKGGVGKSTLSANLAIALRSMGHKVGLVDADVYGPSLPLILDNQGQKPEAHDKKLVPISSDAGVPVLSMGHLVAPGKALAWRGPMVGSALSQLIEADWGDTDLLVVDLPPGTGDVQLTMVQKHKPMGAVLVSTPQDLALIDAARAGQLFDSAEVPIVGLVENMSGYACPHCGEHSDPFGEGGVEAAAARLELPFLGRIPLDPAIRVGSDTGKPPAAGGGATAAPFVAIAEKVSAWIGENA